MKKILYTLLAVTFVFSACKKEDEVVTPTVISGCTDAIATNYNSSATNDDGSCTYSVVGVWTPTSVTQDSSLTTIIDGEIVTDLMGEIMTYSGSVTMTPEEADLTGTLEFTDNGQAIFSGEGDTSTYIYSNNIITIIDEDGESNELTCTFIGTNIALTMSESMDTSWTDPDLIMLGYPEGNISISAVSALTINCSKSTAVNTNVSQRVGETNHSWFVKPKFDNILKNIK